MKETPSLFEICAKYIVTHYSLFKPEDLSNLTQQAKEGIHFERLKMMSASALCNYAKENKDNALYVLKTPVLLKKLGEYNQAILENYAEYAPSMLISEESKLYKGDYLYEICKAYPEAKAYALANNEIRERLGQENLSWLENPSIKFTDFYHRW